MTAHDEPKGRDCSIGICSAPDATRSSLERCRGVGLTRLSESLKRMVTHPNRYQSPPFPEQKSPVRTATSTAQQPENRPFFTATSRLFISFVSAFVNLSI